MGIQTASNSLGPEVRLMIFELIRCYMFIASDYMHCCQMDLEHQFVGTSLMMVDGHQYCVGLRAINLQFCRNDEV